MLCARIQWYASRAGRFTQQDPIGLAGGLNLYGYAKGDPINSSDPFGLSPDDSAQVGCRPLGGAAGTVGNHCAVRVVADNGNVKFGGELLNEGTNAIRALSEDAPDAGDYRWVTLPVPSGMSADEYAKRIMSSYYTVGARVEGKKYSLHGNVNSNKFVFSIVTRAGGWMPTSVLTPLKLTPGICGGDPSRWYAPVASCR